MMLLIGLESPFSRFLPAVQARTPSQRNPLPIVPYTNGDDDEKALTALLGELDSFVSNAVSYLVRISHSIDQDPTFPGRFTYQTDLRDSLHPSLQTNYWEHNAQPDYNLLRHNGAIYALSEAYNRNEKKRSVVVASNHHKKSIDRNLETVSASIRDTMERAVGYLRDNALLPVPDHKEEWLAAWERVDPNDPHSEPDTAKLGGAGLAMIALARLEGIKPNAVCEEELRRLGAFVESLQNKVDGSFICKYQWGVGPYDEWVSLYYPGEAALGLVMLAEFELSLEEQQHQKKNNVVHSGEAQLELHHYSHGHHHDEGNEKHSKRWIKVATDALLYLERLRRDESLEEVKADHWALLATARLLPILDKQRQDLNDESRERKQADLEYWLVYNHGVKVANSIVADHTTAGLKEHNGCFTYDSRTCGTATRLEGLLAAMTFIGDSEMYLGTEDDAAELLKDRIERDVGMGIRFLLNAQQKNDHNNMRGAIPGKFVIGDPQPPEQHHSGSSDEEHDLAFDLAEVRVDYVQHSLSAVIAYESFLLGRLEKNHGEKAFHEKVQEVYKVYHKVKRHVKHRFDIATASQAFVNYAILGSICFLVSVAVCLAYSPCSIFSFLAGRRRRRRRNKRKD